MILKLITLMVFSFSVNAEVLRLGYEGFTIWLDCEKHSAIKFQYNAQRDTGNFKRHKRFYSDKNVPSRCRQTSTKSYKHKLDRGHLVPANHLDYSKLAIKQSNFMTNVSPQARNMNRGAWLLTEEITECYRDIDELLIIGGVIWKDESNNLYLKSHSVSVPSAYWKVIIRNDRVISWIVPNSSKAKRKRLDEYLVSIKDIERITGESIPVADYLKHDKPNRSWLVPRDCNKG